LKAAYNDQQKVTVVFNKNLLVRLNRERFAELISYALKAVGCQHTLLADSGMELLRLASQGLPRQAGRTLKTAMQMAVPKGLNHLPDDLLQQAIEALR